MALTADRWFTVVEFVETSGKKSQRRYEQSAPADDAAARASAAALVADLAAVTDAEISAYHTYQEFVEDALTLPSAAELQNQVVMNFSIDDAPTKSATVIVPAPKQSIFAGATGPNYDILDTTDSDVIALAANFTTEELFYVSDGEQADALLGGKRRHTRSPSS